MKKKKNSKFFFKVLEVLFKMGKLRMILNEESFGLWRVKRKESYHTIKGILGIFENF